MDVEEEAPIEEAPAEEAPIEETPVAVEEETPVEDTRRLFRPGIVRFPNQDWTVILARFSREMYTGPNPDYYFRNRPPDHKQGVTRHLLKIDFTILNSILGDNNALTNVKFFLTFSPGDTSQFQQW